MSRYKYNRTSADDRMKREVLIKAAFEALQLASHIAVRPGAVSGWLHVTRWYTDDDQLVAYYRPAKGDWRFKGERTWRAAHDVVDFLNQFAPGALRGDEWSSVLKVDLVGALTASLHRKSLRDQHRDEEKGQNG